jgi:hypothetical protein
VRLLERGSDDVLVKPFSYPELRARIAAVLWRTAPAGHSHSCSPARCAPIYATAACPSTSASGALRSRVPALVPPGRRAHSRVDKYQLWTALIHKTSDPPDPSDGHVLGGGSEKAPGCPSEPRRGLLRVGDDR